MLNKGGQFFIVAALIIGVILIGLGTIYISTQSTKEETKVFDLSKEIDFESAQVIDNGIYNDLNQQNLRDNIENLTEYYSTLNPNSDIFAVYGDSSEIFIVFFNNTKIGSIGISTGGSEIGLQEIISLRKYTGQETPIDNKVSIELTPGISQEFNLKKGQNFFIVVKKEDENSRIISTDE